MPEITIAVKEGTLHAVEQVLPFRLELYFGDETSFLNFDKLAQLVGDSRGLL
jgi:hypothetical protein